MVVIIACFELRCLQFSILARGPFGIFAGCFCLQKKTHGNVAAKESTRQMEAKFIIGWSKNADIQMLILNCNPVSDHFYKLITCELIFEYLHE